MLDKLIKELKLYKAISFLGFTVWLFMKWRVILVEFIAAIWIKFTHFHQN